MANLKVAIQPDTDQHKYSMTVYTVGHLWVWAINSNITVTNKPVKQKVYPLYWSNKQYLKHLKQRKSTEWSENMMYIFNKPFLDNCWLYNVYPC